MSFEMDRKTYAQMFGPTTGDSVRLGDTGLYAKIERDMTVYGQESIFGGGKVFRDGMGCCATRTRETDKRMADEVITNALIIDYTGVYKADIGIRDGKIFAIGKAGNPDLMDDVDIVVGASTEIMNADSKIVTAGAIDTHVHYITPEIGLMALDNGVTCLFGGGSGNSNGTKSATCTPGAYNIEEILKGFEGVPINFGTYAKAGGVDPELIGEQLKAGACGIKLHEDWGACASTMRNALKAADMYDVQLAIHTDSLNEGGYVDNTLNAVAGRTCHSYHTEGAGGGHAPDIMVIAGQRNFLPSSTSPTNPYGVNTVPELFDMTMVCHSLNPSVPEDVAFAESRVRKQTIAAEDVLQDMGAISMMSSDAMAMGRVGEVVMRSWQLADKMKMQRGPLEGDTEFDDNNRIKRYVAKYTINPAIAAGISDYVGSVEVGKYADLVMWDFQSFGAKPNTIFINGFVAYADMGDAGSSLPNPEPTKMTRLFGSVGKALGMNFKTYVSRYAYEHGIKERLGLDRLVLPSQNNRDVTKNDMKHNTYTPKTIAIDPQKFTVTIDGEVVSCEPMDSIALAQRYYLY